MKIKENIITTLDQPEAVQENGDNWNQEEMLQAAVGLIDLDSDLQSSGNSTRTYPYFVIHKWDKQNFRKKVEHFTWNEHRQKLFHAYNDQFNCGNYIFSCFNW